MKVYLISGESYLLINEKVNEIVKDSKNITVFDMNLHTLEEVIVEAGYFSMFQDEKYVIVKNALFFAGDKLKDSDTELLLSYLDKPNDNTTIIFICSEKVDMRKKITKTVKEKYSLVQIINLKYYEIEKRVSEFFKNLGFKIEEESIKYIVSNSLNNYDIVMSEVNKIVLYYNNPDYVTYQDVVNITSKSINTNNFLFVDSLVDNDLKRSLELLNDLKVMKVEPTVLLSLIARDFRIMLNVKISLENGVGKYEMMNNLGLMDWQLDKYIKKVFTYKIKELESILLKLADMDLDIKSGKLDRYIALELLILDICEDKNK